MAAQNSKDLTGLEKACVLLIAYGTGVAAEVFKHLTEPEIEQLSAEIIKMQNVDSSVSDAVVAEFEALVAESGSSLGGKNFAAQVLQQAVGSQKASELMGRAATPGRGRPFGSLWELNAGQLARTLKDEHPQIAALVLSYLPAGRAAMVLGELSEEMQADVAHRICTLEEADPEVLQTIEETLQTKLNATGTRAAASGGPKTLVEILNNVDRSIERNILTALQSDDPAVGEQVRDLIFTFEDLPKLEDRTIQLVLREVEQEDLRLALKGAAEEIQSLIFKNMSERAAEMLREDLELVGNARIKDVECAQQKLVVVVRRLIASGEASLKDESAGEGAEESGEEQPDEQYDQVQLAA
jgi:flagellar motor switch protein FliG